MVIYRLCAWFGKSFVEHVSCNTKRYHGLVAGTKVFRGCLAGAATHVRMQAWAESMLRGLHCLQPTVRPRTYANVVSIGLGLDHVEWRS